MKDINLLPDEIKSTSTYLPQKTGGVGISAKVLVGVVVAILVFGATFLLPQVYIKTLEMQLDSIKKEIASEKYDVVKQVRADTSKIDGVLSSKRDVLDTIDSIGTDVNQLMIAIGNTTPKGCVLGSVDYKAKSNTLEITGIVEDNIALAEFVAQINRLSTMSLSSDIKLEEGNVFSISLKVGGKEGK